LQGFLLIAGLVVVRLFLKARLQNHWWKNIPSQNRFEDLNALKYSRYFYVAAGDRSLFLQYFLSGSHLIFSIEILEIDLTT